jgi:hypothetical protein
MWRRSAYWSAACVAYEARVSAPPCIGSRLGQGGMATVYLAFVAPAYQKALEEFYSRYVWRHPRRGPISTAR